MALSAGAGAVRGMFLRHGLWLTAAGIALGIGAALVLTRVMSALLYQHSFHERPRAGKFRDGEEHEGEAATLFKESHNPGGGGKRVTLILRTGSENRSPV